MKSLVLLSLLMLLVGCTKHTLNDPTPASMPDIQLSCLGNLSTNFGSAEVNGESVCYSTNSPLYKNFAYSIRSSSSNSAQTGLNQPEIQKNKIQVGVGGLGSPDDLMAPFYFYVETPAFEQTVGRSDYLRQVFQKGNHLDIRVSDAQKGNLSIADTKFKIGLVAQYSNKGNIDVANFYTWTGEQQIESAYLIVKDVVLNADLSHTILLSFQCRLYDNHGNFYAEITNGQVQFTYTD